ncbi:MAG: DMT family transporter [Spirochaetaceae bacterium]|nr:DMT family transporter [Spirochaetaceae bacterium]
MLLAILSAALFGAATPLSKGLLGSIGPFTLAGLLYLGAGLALAPWALRGLVPRGRVLNRRNRRHALGSVLAGGIAGPVLLLFGLRAASSSSVSLWLNMELVATAVLGHFLFRDTMTKRGALAAIGILAASVLLSFEGGTATLRAGLLVAGACVAWGFDNHFTALIDGLSPETSTFIKGIAAGAVNLAIGLLAEGRTEIDPATLGGALAIGALSYGASIVLYIASAQGLGASRAQLFFSSAPLFGLALAAILLGEAPTPARAAALGLMGLSWALLLGDRHAHDHVHPKAVHTHWHRHGEGHHGHGHASLTFPARIFGHGHEHAHEEAAHRHPHVSDIHHRHAHPGEVEE